MATKLKKTNKTAAKKKIKAAKMVVSPEQVIDTSKIEEPAQKKESVWQKIGNAALGIAKTVAPIAANSFIPGSGAVVSGLLSTLNDDEWFSEYAGNGASFNELLSCQTYDVKMNGHQRKMTSIVPALGESIVSFNATKGFLDQFMPSVLSFVRNKTNNVLIEDAEVYYRAFYYSTEVVMVYYQLEKLVKLSLDVPSQVPTINEVYGLMQPKNLNSLVGIRDSLRDYIKSTIALPYALTSYLRWRFGTTFLSDNTQRSGLIHYAPYIRKYDGGNLIEDTVDATNRIASTVSCMNADPVNNLSKIIAQLKTEISLCGRAVADLKVAYSDHVFKYDVEDRHFDEKEKCLRCNMTFEATNSPSHPYPNNRVIMDSRLDMNAAIQAITLSTASFDANTGITDVSLTPFPLGVTHIMMDMTKVNLKAEDYPVQELPGTQVIGTNIPTWRFLTYDSFVQIGEELDSWAGEYTKAVDAVVTAIAGIALQYHVNAPVIYSLQFAPDHQDDTRVPLFVGNPLAYDTATITDSQLEALHRVAMLNLTRGNYKRKEEPEIHEEVKDILEEVTPTGVEVI
jgi:hypothetical protein